MKKSSLPSRRQPLARSKIKRKPRKPSETLRIYGPPARREMVKSMPCAACGVVGYSENAHVAPASEKGTGYKAGYEWIAPLCGERPVHGLMSGLYIGCHEQYDTKRWLFEREWPAFNPEQVAAQTESAWLEYQSTQSNPEGER